MRPGTKSRVVMEGERMRIQRTGQKPCVAVVKKVTADLALVQIGHSLERMWLEELAAAEEQAMQQKNKQSERRYEHDY